MRPEGTKASFLKLLLFQGALYSHQTTKGRCPRLGAFGPPARLYLLAQLELITFPRVSS